MLLFAMRRLLRPSPAAAVVGLARGAVRVGTVLWPIAVAVLRSAEERRAQDAGDERRWSDRTGTRATRLSGR